jgi:CRP-like cAMP-binding protein
MLLGTVVFALIISTASMIVQNSSADDAAHGAKIAVVHQFCSSWNISENLKNHILDFLLLSKDVFVDNTNSSTVLGSLPPDFQCIVTPFLAKDCISRTALFKNCSPEFISLLLEYLSLETFNASDTIFRAGFAPPLSPRAAQLPRNVPNCRAGDISHSLYIIKSGTCLLINNHNVVAAEMTDNDVFGDVSCFLSERRLHTCVCLRFCEVYVLTASKLASIIKIFPDFYAFFSNFCRKKILADASAKRQFSAASCELPRYPSMPSSPHLTSRPAPLSPPLLLPLRSCPRARNCQR